MLGLSSGVSAPIGDVKTIFTNPVYHDSIKVHRSWVFKLAFGNFYQKWS